MVMVLRGEFVVDIVVGNVFEIVVEFVVGIVFVVEIV